MGQDLTPNIPDDDTDAGSPVSESLVTRIRNALLLLNAVIDSNSTSLMAGAVDSVTSGTIVDANPTSGVITQDDQFDGYYIQFTSGAVSAANSRNRFKITATSFVSTSISVAENLASLGVLTADTYKIIGHTHDGAGSEPDGSAIDLKDLMISECSSQLIFLISLRAL